MTQDADTLAWRMAVLWGKLVEAQEAARKDCVAQNFPAGLNGYFAGIRKAVALARYWFFIRKAKEAATR